MGATLTSKGGRGSSKALIEYVNRDDELKTERIYTHELSIRSDLAERQLATYRKAFGQENGIQAFHFIQSFDKSFDKNNPNDVQKAYDIGCRYVDKLAETYPNHSIYMGTHTDSKSGYVHNHIIFMNLNNETGRKFNLSKEVTYNLQDLNDEVLKEFNIEQPKEKYKEVDIDYFKQNKRSKREETKNRILSARGEAKNFDDFKNIMHDKYNVHVYEFNKGKRIGYEWLDKNDTFKIGGKKLGTDFEKTHLITYFQQTEQSKESKQLTHSIKPATENIIEPLDNLSDQLSNIDKKQSDKQFSSLSRSLDIINNQLVNHAEQEDKNKKRLQKQFDYEQKRADQQKQQKNNNRSRDEGWDW